MLASRAFPGWSEEQRDVLICNQFTQGVLPSSIQVQLIKEMPKTVKDAVALARRLEAVEVGVCKWKEVRKDFQQLLHLSPQLT